DSGEILNFLNAVADASDIGERDGLAIALGKDDVFKILRVCQPPHCSHGILGAAGSEVASWNFDVLPAYGVPHLVDGETVSVHTVRIDEQLDFTPAIAKKKDRSHAGYGLDVLLDLSVGDKCEFFGVALSV